MFFKEYTDEITNVLIGTEITDRAGKIVNLEDGFARIINLLYGLRQNNKKMFFIGNGGSAAIASHMAIDFSKRAGIKGICFNDFSQLTCLSNDLGYENVFSFPLSMFLDENDMLVAISSSGCSKNILKGVEVAKDKKGVVITLSGFKKDNPLRRLGDFNIYTSSFSYGVVESAHAVICHFLLDTISDDKEE